MESFAFASMKKSFLCASSRRRCARCMSCKSVEKVDLAQFIHWNLIISTANSRAETRNMSVSIQKWFSIDRDEGDGWGVRDGRQRCTMTAMPAQRGKAGGAGYAARDFLRMKRNENFHRFLHSNVDWHFSLSLFLSLLFISFSVHICTTNARTRNGVYDTLPKYRFNEYYNVQIKVNMLSIQTTENLFLYVWRARTTAPTRQRQQRCEWEYGVMRRV